MDDLNMMNNVILLRNEQVAVNEILISSKSMSGVSRKRIMDVLQTRRQEEFVLFLNKVNAVHKGVFRVLYDEQLDRCVAVTRMDSHSINMLDILDEKHIALLMFCYYFCMTSRSNSITYEELLQYFQRSSLHAERKLQRSLDKLIKLGYLHENETDLQNGQKKITYSLTIVGRHAFSERYLKHILDQSQGGEVSMEQVRDFFKTNRPLIENDVESENTEEYNQTALFVYERKEE